MTMDIQKGVCRIKLKSGLIAFGEVLEVKEGHIVFLGLEPSAIGTHIQIKNIVEIEKYDEDDVPAYE
jgi:hypothetical protein